jgi:hypothetical protein
MNLSDVFSAVMTLRRVVVIASILGGAGYKLAPMVWHKSDAKPMTAKSMLAVAVTNQTIAAATGNKTAAVNSIRHDLGDVSLTNHSETCVQLGGGKDCILSPKMIDSRNVQITFALESKSSVGKIHDLSVAQVVARTGKPVEVALGDFNLTLTPQMTSE